MVFTGIVQGTAEVTDVESTDKFSQVKIKFPPNKVDNVKVGASVSINGTCLTVTDAQRDSLSFDIMSETLRATNLGELGAGSVVNFERAAKLGDEVGGHNVSGHVHTTATITSIEQLPNSRRVAMTLSDPRWIKYVLPKGFIAVDGTSLTVGEVSDHSFSVYLIPETLRITVFGIKSVGDTVNIEVESQTQAIVDTVERVIMQYMERSAQQALTGAVAGPVATALAVAATAAANDNGMAAAVTAQAPDLAQQQLAAAVVAQQQQQLQAKQQELAQQRLQVQRQLEELTMEQQRLQQELETAAVAVAVVAQTAAPPPVPVDATLAMATLAQPAAMSPEVAAAPELLPAEAPLQQPVQEEQPVQVPANRGS